MDLIKAMRVFVRCVERGSFSAVAKEFSTTQPTISKLMSALEARLGGDLFVRATQGVRLTTQGQDYYLQCKDIVQAVAEAETGFGQARATVAGQVRLSASMAFGRLQVMPHMSALLAQYPKLHIDLHLSDRTVDLVAEDVDLAFRFGPLKDSRLVSRRIGASRRATVAAPAYLRHHGTPEHPSDLAQHECIQFDVPSSVQSVSGIWTYRAKSSSQSGTKRPPLLEVATRGRIRTNSPEAVCQAALAGLGVAQISQWMLGKELRSRRLRALLGGYETPEQAVYAVWLPGSRNLARVRAVVDFYEAVFQKDADLSVALPASL